jgi:hypothetical protein
MIKLTDILFENSGCCSRPKAPLLVEGVRKTLLSENLQHHIDNKLPLTENTFRYKSKAFMELWNEARDLHKAGIILLEGDDKQIVEETDLGTYAKYNGNVVPLDLIMEDLSAMAAGEEEIADEPISEADKKKKNPPLNKPKRGGSKAYYVYVRDPKTKKIKKVSFGSSGLRAKINNPKARKAFAARHKCSQKTDRTKPSYWSCRLPRYSSLLGMKSSFSGFW